MRSCTAQAKNWPHGVGSAAAGTPVMLEPRRGADGLSLDDAAASSVRALILDGVDLEKAALVGSSNDFSIPTIAVAVPPTIAN